MVSETTLTPRNLVYPLFVMDGKSIKEPINSMPGQFRYTIDELMIAVENSYASGLRSFALFPKVDDSLKDKMATYSYDENCFYGKAIKTLKDRFSDITIFSDVAMDPYSSDGHDGIVKEGKILNDETLDILAKMAIFQAKCGSDFISPSDMMDGRIGYLREALDSVGHKDTGLMSYCAKYASAFYGPFRDALDSAPKAGDKKTYQMDYRNSSEALREAHLDQEEGADIIMVKPALSYLDIINNLNKSSQIPIAAYFVSGEYAMLKGAASLGYLNFDEAILEATTSVKRAGANIIFTYAAPELVSILGF